MNKNKQKFKVKKCLLIKYSKLSSVSNFKVLWLIYQAGVWSNCVEQLCGALHHFLSYTKDQKTDDPVWIDFVQTKQVKKTEEEGGSVYKQKCVSLNTRHRIIMIRWFPHRYISLLFGAITLPFIILGLELLTDEIQAEILGGQFEVM